MVEIRNRRALMIVVAVLALGALACSCGGLGNLVPSGGGSSTFDGGDGLDTTGGGTISVGGSANGTLNSIFEAHNWTFEGAAGQTVTISVVGQGDCDPRTKLIDPQGNVLAEDDDSGGGYNSYISYTLPSAGRYTIRVDVYTTGSYTVTLQ